MADVVGRVLPRLVEKRLVPATAITDLTLDGFELVLRHDQVELTAYPNEWCAEMLRAASLVYLDLVVELADKGLGIKDMNPWNLVFDGTRPLFVDVMSIAPAEACASSFTEARFRRYYLDPLRLMAHGQSGLARALLPEYGGVEPGVLPLLRGRRPFARLPDSFRRSRRESVALAASLRREVEAVNLRVAGGEAGTDVPDRGRSGARRVAALIGARASNGDGRDGGLRDASWRPGDRVFRCGRGGERRVRRRRRTGPMVATARSRLHEADAGDRVLRPLLHRGRQPPAVRARRRRRRGALRGR